MKSKYICRLIIILFLIFVNNTKQTNANIESFPDSYKPYLYELKSRYPNWTFTPQNVNLDWTYVINNQNVFGKNLVPKSYSDVWKNLTPGQYNVEVDAGWVDSSRQAIEYCMDPRNFLNYIRIFQFEELSSNENTNSKSAVERILYGTEFYNKSVSYYTQTGSLVNTSSLYSDLILKAAGISNVSSYHIASRIKQEVGPFLSHSSISGTLSGYEGLYNFYNIGATSSSEPLGAIKNGLNYARNGNGASQATLTKYLIPWTTKDISITGGANFIGSSYINAGQNTVYLQKFHVIGNSSSLFWHQYMTNVLAPYSESYHVYNGYNQSGLLTNDSSISFMIPVYNNMPNSPVSNPNISSLDFVADNTKMYADVTTTLNVRAGPQTNYEAITTITRNDILTRVKKGVQSGDLWDQVVLPNGITGYVFSSYLKEYIEEPEILIEDIQISIDNATINKGDTSKIQITTLPQNVKEETYIFKSDNENVAVVDNYGNILAVSSGTTSITVTTSKTNISKTIQVNVYSKVTDILVNMSEIYLEIGDSFELDVQIIPSDASNKNISYISENENIAIIDSSGKITAVDNGNTNITVISEDSKQEKQISVIVLKQLEEGDVVFDESLRVESNILSNLDMNNITVENLKEKIQTKYTVQVIKDNQELKDNENIGTGTIVKILDDNQNILAKYNILIYGDVNGDGNINSVDLLVLQRHILEIEMLNGIYNKAGNINKNGNNPSSLDSLLIQRHILEISYINQ